MRSLPERYLPFLKKAPNPHKTPCKSWWEQRHPRHPPNYISHGAPRAAGAVAWRPRTPRRSRPQVGGGGAGPVRGPPLPCGHPPALRAAPGPKIPALKHEGSSAAGMGDPLPLKSGGLCWFCLAGCEGAVNFTARCSSFLWLSPS